jgi:hypothetical protein
MRRHFQRLRLEIRPGLRLPKIEFGQGGGLAIVLEILPLP